MMTQQKSSGSTFEEYKYMYHKRLKDGEVKVMFSENVLRCPYCPESREYDDEELCRHASRIARESKSASLKEKAKHMALLEFMILEEKSKRKEEVERKIKMTDYLMASVMKHKDMMVDNFNRDVKMIQERENEQIKKISNEYEQSKLQLEEHEKEVRAREAINKSENEKEKKMNEMTILEKKKANDRMLKLADDHKREKEKLHQKTIELQKQIDDKQVLELEIRQLKGAIEVMKHAADEDAEAKKKLESIKKVIKEKQGDKRCCLSQEDTIRYLVPELWNNKEERKATLKEGVEYILKQWKLYKHKKRC